MFDRVTIASKLLFESYGRWLLVVLISVACESRGEGLGDDLLRSIKRSWDEHVSRDARVQWQVIEVPELTCVSACRTEFAELDSGPSTKSSRSKSSWVLLHDRGIQFESQRYARLRHQPDRIQNSFEQDSPLQFSPELEREAAIQSGPDFSDAMATSFANPALEVGALVTFTRTVTPDYWLDQWGTDSEGNSRATVRSFLKAGTPRWARLTVECDLSDQIDSLHCQAALLAMRRVHCPTIDLQWQSCRLLTESQMVDGRQCVVMVETAGSEVNQRVYWIDRAAPFLIRRFRGQVPLEPLPRPVSTRRGVPPRFGDTMIELEYAPSDTTDWKPVGWSVLSSEGPEWPLRAFSRATVNQVDFASAVPGSIAGDQRRQPIGHGWVINEITNDQYVALDDGTIREITDEELRLFPTFDELAHTPSGGLADGWMVSRAETYGRWSLGFIGVLLLLLGMRRRWLRSRSVPPCPS